MDGPHSAPAQQYANYGTIMLIGAGISAALGRVNTVGLEIAAFALGMTWLSLFVGNTEQGSLKLEPDSFPD